MLESSLGAKTRSHCINTKSVLLFAQVSPIGTLLLQTAEIGATVRIKGILVLL